MTKDKGILGQIWDTLNQPLPGTKGSGSQDKPAADESDAIGHEARRPADAHSDKPEARAPRQEEVGSDNYEYERSDEEREDQEERKRERSEDEWDELKDRQERDREEMKRRHEHEREELKRRNEHEREAAKRQREQEKEARKREREREGRRGKG